MIFNVIRKSINKKQINTLYTVLDILYKINYIGLKNKTKNTFFSVPNCLGFIIKQNYIILISNYIKILHSIKSNIYKVETYMYRIYTLKLDVTGVGYKVFFINNYLIFLLGYSHFIKIKVPSSLIQVYIIANRYIILKDRQQIKLGAIMYVLKRLKPLNIYKGHGVKNIYEKLKLKLGTIKTLKQ